MSQIPPAYTPAQSYTFVGVAFAQQLEAFLDSKGQNAAVFQMGVLHDVQRFLNLVRDAIIGRPPASPMESSIHYALFHGAYRQIIQPGEEDPERINYWLLRAHGIVAQFSRPCALSEYDIESLRDLAAVFRVIAHQGDREREEQRLSDPDDD